MAEDAAVATAKELEADFGTKGDNDLDPPVPGRKRIVFAACAAILGEAHRPPAAPLQP